MALQVHRKKYARSYSHDGVIKWYIFRVTGPFMTGITSLTIVTQKMFPFDDVIMIYHTLSTTI